MAILSAYLPRDRCRALQQSVDLPDRTEGAALFADISGFTPLAETLAKLVGPQRGAEALTSHLNRVYEAVIGEVRRFRGSVVNFAGDAITCWFDQDTGHRAVASAFAMQEQMRHFASIPLPNGEEASLAMKVSVASGPVRRFRVGDPSIQFLDTLAGNTLARLVAAERQARKGEVILDARTAAHLADCIAVTEWRADSEQKPGFAVVGRLSEVTQPEPWPSAAKGDLEAQVIRPWLLPIIYERLVNGQGQFLAELRPAVTVFLSFDGIDFDQDELAGKKLDKFIQWIQRALAVYEGHLLGLVIGDKGSYLYASFGAPLAHDDDPTRAVAAATALISAPSEFGFIQNVRAGICQGRVWAGAYGAESRCTYGVLGDSVNMAARLMQSAAPREILATQAIQQATQAQFSWDPLGPLSVKGKSQPVAVFRWAGTKHHTTQLREPAYTLPMVGRHTELALLKQKLNHALERTCQIVGITGDAGMGKSRLISEVIRASADLDFVRLAGQCQSYGKNIPYLVWQPIWNAFFGLEPNWSLEQKVQVIQQQLEAIDPALVPRLPLLGLALNLNIPDNDLTRSLDPKIRKASLEGLLVDCLKARALATPLLLVLEDCHWLDQLSSDLLETIGRTLVEAAGSVVLLVAYRPPSTDRTEPPVINQLQNFTEIRLTDLNSDEAAGLIRLKLDQLDGFSGPLPPPLVEKITHRAQGNPFYIEELLNYLKDLGLDPHHPTALDQLDLPDSLHSLILSRIDQLSEHQKIVLKVASVIGRQFRADWLWGTHPGLGDRNRVRDDLNALSRLDLTPLDTPEPNLTFVFKHIVTQEVAYESLARTTRSQLHGQLGYFLEETYHDSLPQYVDLLAFHFDRSAQEPKRREYLFKAGEAAARAYSNKSATDYYGRLLTVLPELEHWPILQKLGELFVRVGRWKEAGDLYQRSLKLAERLSDRNAQAWSETSIGELLRKQGAYGEAATWLRQAQQAFEAIGDKAGVAQTLHYAGTLAAQQGNYEKARDLYEQSLDLRRDLHDRSPIGSLLSNLAILSHQYFGEPEKGIRLYEESLQIRRDLGDRWAIANSLNNLGVAHRDLGALDRARQLLQESLLLNRQVGDRWATANCLSSLADVAIEQKDVAAAREFLVESLAINRDLDEPRAVAFCLEYAGRLALLENRAERALYLLLAATALRENIGAPLSPAELPAHQKLLRTASESLSPDECVRIARKAEALRVEEAISYAIQSET